MAIGISSSFNEPEWDFASARSGGISDGQKIMRERIIAIIDDLDEEIHDNYGESGRATADLIMERILTLTI